MERDATSHLAGGGLLLVARQRPGPACSGLATILSLVRLSGAQQQRVETPRRIGQLIRPDAVTRAPAARPEDAVDAPADVARPDPLPAYVGGAPSLLKSRLVGVHGANTLTSSSVVLYHIIL